MTEFMKNEKADYKNEYRTTYKSNKIKTINVHWVFSFGTNVSFY